MSLSTAIDVSQTPPPRSLRIAGLDGLLYAGLFVLFACSSLVLSEPAPYDFVLVMLMGGAVFAGLRVQRAIGPLFVMIALTIVGDVIGSTQANDLTFALKHSSVTLYLSASAVFFACLAASRPERFMAVVVPAMTIAALITAIAGIAGMVGLHPSAEKFFTIYGRASGTFKDPNVMAPFLVLPILFGLHRLMTRSLLRAWPWLIICGILAVAVFLSFSRGAWAHLAASIMIYSGIFFVMAPSAAARARLVLLGAIATVVAVAGIAVVLSDGKINSMFDERASLSQKYDSAETGRFAGQKKGFFLTAENPAGMGAGDFSNLHGEEVHNVYLNAFINGGWLGGFAYLGLVVTTIFIATKSVFRRSRLQPYLMPVVAGFLGLALEGLIVDTDHWRHFYLLTGLIWGLYAAAQRP